MKPTSETPYRKGLPCATHPLALLAVLVLALSLPACTDDPVREAVNEPDHIRAPASREELFTRFKAAYEARDLAAYTALLHPDFELRYLETDSLDRIVGPAQLTRGQDLQSSDHMFSGRQGWDRALTQPIGEIVGIEFGVWNLVDWSDAAARDSVLAAAYPGCQCAEVYVEAVFRYANHLGGTSQYDVSEIQDLYAVPSTVKANSREAVTWTLLRQDDTLYAKRAAAGAGKANSRKHWSDVNLTYLDEPVR